MPSNPSDGLPQDSITSRGRSKAARIGRRIGAIVLSLVLILFVAFNAAFSVGQQQVQLGMMRDKSATRTVAYAGKRYKLNEDLINFLVLGFDGRNKNGMDGQTDVFMVTVVNTKTGESKVITIPRDSMVESPYYAGDVMIQAKMELPICLSYAFAGGGEFGAETAKDVVSNVLGDVPIPYYYMINYKGMPDINDAIGGVPLTPIQSVPDTPIEEGKPIVLQGQLAERYVRWRDHETLQSPMDRQKREMHYANAFMAQAKKQIMRNPLVAAKVLSAAKQWSMTNANAADLLYYGFNALRGNLSDLQVETLPGDLVKVGQYAQFHLDKAGVRKIVIDTFYEPA